jgi:polyferredoxin
MEFPVKITKYRFVVQILFFLLFVYGGKIYIDLNKLLPQPNLHYVGGAGNLLPTFTCPYVTSRVGGCYLMPFQRELGNLQFKNYFSLWGWAVLKGFLIFSIFFLIFDRLWCGWVCPFGTIQDAFSKIRSYLGMNYSKFNWQARKKIRIIKYLLLYTTIGISVFIANPLPFLGKISKDLFLPFCQICPAKALMPVFEGNWYHVTTLHLNKATLVMTILAMFILALTLVGSFFKRRFFCFFCPMLALMRIYRHIRLLQLRKDPSTCTHCESCAFVCPMDIRVITEERKQTKLFDDECILCLSCIDACPEDSTLKLNFLNKTLYRSSRTRSLRK